MKKNKKIIKGLIYGFEAMFAGILIMLYLTMMIKDFKEYSGEEEKILLYRKSIMSFERYLSQSEDFRNLLNEGEEKVLPIFNYFLSPISSYDVYIYKKPKHKPIIGIYTYKNRSIRTNFSTLYFLNISECRKKVSITLPNNTECKEGYSSKIDFSYLLLKIKDKRTFIYFLFIDKNKDGTYQPQYQEGPFVEENIVTIGNTSIYVDELTEDDNVSFMYVMDNKEKALLYFIRNTFLQKIDNVSFIPRISFLTEEGNLDRFDVVFLNKSFQSTAFPDKLYSYFLNGGNIIISKNRNLIPFLTKVGFKNLSLYYVIDNESSNGAYGYINNKIEENIRKYQILGYYNNTPIKLNLYHPSSSCSYNSLQPYDALKIASLNLTKRYFIAVKWYNNSIEIFVDYDGDCNFDESPDNQSLSVGDNFKIEKILFEIYSVNSEHITLKIVNGYIGLINVPLYDLMIYTNKDTTERNYNALLSIKNVYLALSDSYKIGDNIDIPLTNVSTNLWKGVLNLNINHTYIFYVEKKGDDEYLYFENNPLLKYRSGDFMRIDTEIFVVMFNTTLSSNVRFVLAERNEVPIVTDIRNNMGGDVIYYYANINKLSEKTLLVDLLFFVLNNEKIEIYRSDKKEANTGLVLYPIKMGKNTKNTCLIGIRRYV